MASKKGKKRQHSRTVELKRQLEQEKLADQKDRNKKRMDPTARVLLYGDLVFLAVTSIMDAGGVISGLASGICTIIGLVLLILALWFQFRPKERIKGPRLEGSTLLLSKDRVEEERPKPPLLKGGAPQGRGDSVYRESVGRGDLGAPFSGGGRIPSIESTQSKRLPQSPLAAATAPSKREPFPCGGTGGFRLQKSRQ